MKYYICIFFLFYSYLNTHGQLPSQQLQAIDSLKVVIGSNVHDTSKIAAYNAWDNLIYISDPKLDEELNEKIVALAEKNLKNHNLTSEEKETFKKSLGLALNSLGIIFYDKGENIKALDFYSRSLKLRESIADKKGVAATLNNLGIVYQDQADYKRAIDSYEQSLKVNEEINDKSGEADCLSNIGRIYVEQKEPQKAIEYQYRSLEIRKKLNDKRAMAISYNNIAAIHSMLEKPDKAIEFFKKGLTLSNEIGDQKKIALALGNLGAEYIRKGQNTEALSYLTRSTKILEEIGDEKSLAAFFTHISDIYKQNGEISKSINFLKQALLLAQKVGHTSIIRDASRSLADIYKKEKRYSEALTSYELYMKTHNSILNEANQKEILKRELQHNYDKQKVANEKKLAISLERENTQKDISFAIASCLTIVSVLSIVLFKRFKISNQQKAIIEKQNSQIIESINYSKKIQESLLPSIEVMQKSVSGLYIFNKPKDIVSGDFYFFKETNNYFLFICADCTGHGVPGGFMCTLGSLLLDKIVSEGVMQPSQILKKLNKEIIRVLHQHNGSEIQDGIDLSICLIDKISHVVEYSGARNSITVVRNEEALRYKADPIPVGGSYLKPGKLSEYEFKTQNISLCKNDWLYMYTDGYIEQIGGKDDIPMNSKQFENILISLSRKQNFDEKNDFLLTEFNLWKKTHNTSDDILILGIQPVI